MNAIARELRENPLLWLLAAVPAVFAAERVAAGEEESTWPLPVAGALLVGVTVLVGPVDEYLVGLRLARDVEGRDLVLTEREARRADRRARARASCRSRPWPPG